MSLRDPSRCAARCARVAGPAARGGLVAAPLPTYLQWDYRPIASPARGRYATPRYLRRQSRSIHPSITVCVTSLCVWRHYVCVTSPDRQTDRCSYRDVRRVPLRTSKKRVYPFCTNWQGSNVYKSSSNWSFFNAFFLQYLLLFSSLSTQYNYKLQIFLYKGLACSLHKLTNLYKKKTRMILDRAYPFRWCLNNCL